MLLARRRLVQAASGVVFLVSARLATAASEAPAPPHGKKTVHFLRHGQAQHNPRAEAARAGGCSFYEFLRLMKEDDAFDAALTELGRQQAREAAARLGDRVATVELVVCSPLSRALDTATLVLPGATARGPFLAHDDLRERSGWMLNAKRRTRAELAARAAPAVDLSLLRSEADELWEADELEPKAVCAERGYQLLRWLSEERAEAESCPCNQPATSLQPGVAGLQPYAAVVVRLQPYAAMRQPCVPGCGRALTGLLPCACTCNVYAPCTCGGAGGGCGRRSRRALPVPPQRAP